MDEPKLLVIDDEIDIGETIAEIAADRGFNVKAIFNPEDLDRTLEEFTPDAIMLDLMMPGIDGVEMLRILSTKVKSAKITLMSGSDARVLNGAKRLGEAHGLSIIAALEKPLDITALRQTLDSIKGASLGGGASQIAAALEAGQIVPHFQPIVTTDSRSVFGFEALARWHHPEKGIQPAEEFMELAQRENQLVPLARHILEQSAQAAARFTESGQTGRVSGNLPLASFSAGDFPAFLDGLVSKYRLKPGALALEIAERDFTDPGLQKLLPELKKIGIGIWLGDFGKTALNLYDLLKHPAELFKLDRSLISDLTAHTESEKMSAAVIGLCRGLKKPIAAVGVKDEKTLAALRAMGCDYVQGFGVSPPIALEQALIYKP